MLARMSYDLHVTVPGGITLAAVNEVLAALEAPFVVGKLALDAAGDGAQPDWSLPFVEQLCHAFPILADLSFQPLVALALAFDGGQYHLLSGTYWGEPEVAMSVALAVARCAGKGASILEDKTGEELKGKLTRLEARVRPTHVSLWKKLEARAAAVPAEVADYRRPRPADTLWTHFERIALREHDGRAVAGYARERAARALAAADDAEIERLLAASPPSGALLEPLLDACARAGRPDVGCRVVAHFGAHVREHVMTAVAYDGALAVPYVQFLTSLGAPETDADLLRAALPRARDHEMRAALGEVRS